MTRLGLALRALRLSVQRTTADPTPDYDLASTTYDDYFTRVMGGHAVAMLDTVDVGPGDTVLELACGTGHLTAEIVRRLEGVGAVHAVDKSPGMLAIAREKIKPRAGINLSFSEGDMEWFLRRQPTHSADVIVIGWAICYSQPVSLLQEAARVLRPGGQVAVIETRATALATLRHAFEEVVADDPTMLTAMIRVSLPKDSACLGKWFTKAGLVTTVLREGAQVLPCNTTEEALEWVERSGAGAGFRDAFDMTREQEVRRCLAASLDHYSADHGGLELEHTFVVGVAHSTEARLPVASGR